MRDIKICSFIFFAMENVSVLYSVVVIVLQKYMIILLDLNSMLRRIIELHQQLYIISMSLVKWIESDISYKQLYVIKSISYWMSKLKLNNIVTSSIANISSNETKLWTWSDQPIKNLLQFTSFRRQARAWKQFSHHFLYNSALEEFTKG